MGVADLFMLAGVMLALAALPSSSVALVLAKSTTAGRASGLACAAGIVAGDLAFVAVALAGVSALAAWFQPVSMWARYAAAVYLLYLGCRLCLARGTTRALARSGTRRSLAGDFVGGLLLTLADIKAILFYASLFPAFVDLSAVRSADVAWIVFVTIATVGGVKTAYALGASTVAARIAGAPSARWPARLAGLSLVACSIVLVWRG